MLKIYPLVPRPTKPMAEGEPYCPSCMVHIDCCVHIWREVGMSGRRLLEELMKLPDEQLDRPIAIVDSSSGVFTWASSITYRPGSFPHTEGVLFEYNGPYLELVTE